MRKLLVIILAVFALGCSNKKEKPPIFNYVQPPKEKPVYRPEFVVSDIIYSSPEFKATLEKTKQDVIKKGGTGSSYMLEKHPFALTKDSLSEDFVYNLIESYSDRVENTGIKYRFSPASGKLYEVINGKQKKISFNVDLKLYKKAVNDLKEARKKHEKK